MQITIASRVADERGEQVGQTVGYKIMLEERMSQATRLMFCTSGVLLRKLIGNPELAGVSHVVVDEIHERGINEDLLLIILKVRRLWTPSATCGHRVQWLWHAVGNLAVTCFRVRVCRERFACTLA